MRGKRCKDGVAGPSGKEGGSCVTIKGKRFPNGELSLAKRSENEVKGGNVMKKEMGRRVGMVLAGLVLMGGMAVLAHEGHDMTKGHDMAKMDGHDMSMMSGKKVEKKNVKVTGEVIDITCYLSHDGKGVDHKACGLTCLEKGLPVGIAEAKTGKVYLVATNRHEPANQALKAYMADQVTVTGDVVEGNGMSLLLMSKVEKKK